MAGIVVGSYHPLPAWWLAVLAALVVAACLLWRFHRLQVTTMMAAVVLFGALLVNVRGAEKGAEGFGPSAPFFHHQRELLLQRFEEAGLSGDQYAVVAAMTLGDKSALTRELKETYNVTGASHILALSGLHLGIIYALLSLLTVGRRWRSITQILIILSIWAFVFLVGMPTSVVRAAVMLTVYALLSLGYRERMSVNTLAFTAIVMLLYNPLSLFTVSFQLSFMAVLSILLFAPLFNRAFSAEYLQSHRVVKWLWGIAAVSCAAQIGVAPLIAYYFGRFSPWFLLSNFIVIPAATVILYLSLLVLLIPGLAVLLVKVVAFLNGMLTHLSALPAASIEVSPSLLQVILIYMVILAAYVMLATYKKNDRVG